GTQFEDVLLQLLQQAVTWGWLEQIHPAAVDGGEPRFVAGALVMLVKQVDIVTPLLAPGRQQRVGMLMQQGLIQLERHPRAPLLAAILMPQQVLIGNDIAPVVLAGVEHRQQYLAETPHDGQRLQRLGRQGGDTEDHYPPGQSRRALISAEHLLDKSRMDTG